MPTKPPWNVNEMLLGMTGDGKESWMDCGRPCEKHQGIEGTEAEGYMLVVMSSTSRGYDLSGIFFQRTCPRLS